MTTATEYRRRADGGPDLRGNTTDRRRRREWLVEAWRANVDAPKPEMNAPPKTADEAEYWLYVESVPIGWGIPACRCYRCGTLLTVDTVTADRITPGCRGGRYTRDNIRPACFDCNSTEGGGVRREPDDDGRPW